MPEIQNEVIYAMQPETAPTEVTEHQKFGAQDITDLSWKNLLDAYTCTECGRCTEACPANQTGKKLSPRKIMMDTRDRMEVVGLNNDKNGVNRRRKEICCTIILLQKNCGLVPLVRLVFRFVLY